MAATYCVQLAKSNDGNSKLFLPAPAATKFCPKEQLNTAIANVAVAIAIAELASSRSQDLFRQQQGQLFVLAFPNEILRVSGRQFGLGCWAKDCCASLRYSVLSVMHFSCAAPSKSLELLCLSSGRYKSHSTKKMQPPFLSIYALRLRVCPLCSWPSGYFKACLRQRREFIVNTCRPDN